MMTVTKFSLNTDYLTLFVENDSALVFHHIKQSLFHLSPLSVSLLLALDEGGTEQQAIQQVLKASDCRQVDIESHLASVSDLFNKQPQEKHYLAEQYPEISRSVPEIDSCSSKCYCVNDSYFVIEADSVAFTDEVSRLLAPCRKHNKLIDFYVEIRQHSDHRFSFSCNGYCIEQSLPYEQLMPELIERMQVLAYQKSDYLFCFHGAALKNSNQCLLLPGVSGAGKSTLAAQLAQRGFALYSDEMMVLDPDFNLTALALPIAVKSGSWPVLTAEYPSLAKQSAWRKQDGRVVKYLWPQQFVVSSTPSCQMRLINPEFTAAEQSVECNEGFQEQPLTVIEALAVLTQSGYQVHQKLDINLVERLFVFLSRMTRSRLQYACSNSVLEKLSS